MTPDSPDGPRRDLLRALLQRREVDEGWTFMGTLEADLGWELPAVHEELTALKQEGTVQTQPEQSPKPGRGARTQYRVNSEHAFSLLQRLALNT